VKHLGCFLACRASAALTLGILVTLIAISAPVWLIAIALTGLWAVILLDNTTPWHRARAYKKAQRAAQADHYQRIINALIRERAEQAQARHRRHLAEFRAIANHGFDPWHEFAATALDTDRRDT
jgi:hypothetical protein